MQKDLNTSYKVYRDLFILNYLEKAGYSIGLDIQT